MLIDTHCHLTDEKFVNVTEVLRLANLAGVEKVIMPATSLTDAIKVVELAEREKQYCMVGVHPEEVEAQDDKILSDTITELDKLIKSSKRVVGVGEIGLDFYYDKEKRTKKEQIELFRAQIDLAIKNNLPVAIHMRGDAEEEMKAELLKCPNLRGQFHCFAGSETFLKMILEMGFYVSFCGNITYKSAQNLRDLLKQVPLERLLLETDSPYLSPEPLRGTLNTPGNVKITAEFIAHELSLEMAKLTEATTQNTKCLYSLDI